MRYIILCILWITWCFLHSLFTATGTTKWFKDKLGKRFIYYRICYNLFSLVTVIPLLYWQGSIPSPVIIPLSPLLKMVKLAAVVLAMVIVGGSFFSFDIREFLGIRQLDKNEVKERPPEISEHGFYGIVRHPMYLGGFLFFIALMTDASLAQFLGYLILAVYMVIGTVREDNRLSEELGELYKSYKKKVPLFFSRLKK
jgi:protein-S-isoprenylcysteine O-methyltransferase Ste14